MPGNGRVVTVTSFNMPSVIYNDATSQVKLELSQYGPEHQRLTAVVTTSAGTRTTLYLNPDNAGGLAYEKETSTITNSVAQRSFITAYGQVVAVVKQITQSSATTTTTSYFHRDNLGSVTAVSDATGSVQAPNGERLFYDDWGKRRFGSGADDPSNTITGNTTHRGFTNHEMLDELTLVHMNGRIYDPVIGRFVSPDPQIQNPYDLQSYNRYSYASNNPLIYTDPTGYSLWTKIRNTVIRVAAAVADAYGCSGYCSTSVGAYQGYQSGGWTGAITGGIGGYYSVQYPLTDGGNINWGNVGTLASINAGTGCINAAAGGGSCGRGALSGAVGTVGAAYGYMGAAIAGCAAGRIGGGSCREGAIEGIGTYAVSRAASGGFSYIMDALRPPPPQSASGSSGNTGNTEGVKNTSEVPTNEQQGRFILAANDLPVKETTEFGAAIVPNAKKIEASDDTLEAIMAQDPMNGKRPHAEVKGSVGELNRARIEPVVDQTRKGAPVAKKWWEWGLP